MHGTSIIAKILILLILGIFLFGVATVIDPLDYWYKFQDDKRKEDLKSVQIALEKYYKQFGVYPESSEKNIQPCEGDNLILQRNPNTKEIEPVRWGTKWFGFLEPLPKDPDPSRCYVYYVSPSQQSYWLYASLDRGTKDPQACGVKGKECNNMIGNMLQNVCKKSGVTSSYICNYGVSSVNESL